MARECSSRKNVPRMSSGTLSSPKFWAMQCSHRGAWLLIVAPTCRRAQIRCCARVPLQAVEQSPCVKLHSSNIASRSSRDKIDGSAGCSQVWSCTESSGWSISVTTSGQPVALIKTDLLVPGSARGNFHLGGESQREGEQAESMSVPELSRVSPDLVLRESRSGERKMLVDCEEKR